MNPILHIPHSSTAIPQEYRDTFLLDEDGLQTELLRMTDHFTEELFSVVEGGIPLVFPVSRLLVDPERFEDDCLEPMAKKGMGILYTQTHDLQPLRRALASSERQALIERYYRPHHSALTQLVDSQLADSGEALVIDCHSFPSRRLPYMTPVREGDFPQICLGTDEFHTPSELRDKLLVAFAEQGLTVGLNYPFAGALTPLKHYRHDSRVRSIMIEVRRDLYMNEYTGDRAQRFSEIQEAIRCSVDRISKPFPRPR